MKIDVTWESNKDIVKQCEILIFLMSKKHIKYETSYVRKTGLKSLVDFTKEERKVLLRREEKKVCITDAKKLYTYATITSPS